MNAPFVLCACCAKTVPANEAGLNPSDEFGYSLDVAGLEDLDDDTLKASLAIIAGQLAHRHGASATDAMLRRIGDRLMFRPRVSHDACGTVGGGL